MSKQMSKDNKQKTKRLTAWDLIALEEGLNLLMKKDAIHKESAQALLNTVRLAKHGTLYL